MITGFLLDWVDSHYHFVHDNIKIEIPDGEIIDRPIHSKGSNGPNQFVHISSRYNCPRHTHRGAPRNCNIHRRPEM